MNLANRFSSNKSESNQNTQENLNSLKNWNNVASNANFEAQAELGVDNIAQASEQIAQQERQERKTISALLHGPIALKQLDASISERDRELAYQELANGNFNDTYKSQIIQNIATPFHKSPENTLNSLSTKRERHILGYFSGLGSKNWESTSVDSLQGTLNRFPTPYELAKPEQEFLDYAREHNSPEKYAEYQAAMESFKQKVYGKRLEYYNTMESLQQKANQKAAEDDSRTQVLNIYANSAPTSPETTKNVEIHQLNPQEQQEILQNSKINGDDFIYNGAAYKLTPESLKNLGLAPNYSFTIGNAKINLSKPYDAYGHPTFTAYVQTKKGTNVCSYYRSKSQGTWRLLPDYVSDPYNPNNAIDWLGKGYNEESLNLPGETQRALELITRRGDEVSLNPINAEFALTGTAKRYNSRKEYAEHKRNHTLHGQHYDEVDSTPYFNLGEAGFKKASPDSLDLSGPGAPNFQVTQDSYATNSKLYGQFQTEHIPSQDNNLEYTFNRNTEGQAWLGGIEVKNAPLSSYGLRTKWASAGDFGTPLYEYTKQSDGYGDPNRVNGVYTNMWTNYLSRMPLIRKYLATRKSA